MSSTEAPVVLVVDRSGRRIEQLAGVLTALGFEPVAVPAEEEAELPDAGRASLALVAFDGPALLVAGRLRRSDPLLPLVVHGSTPPSLEDAVRLGNERAYDFLLLEQPTHLDRYEDRLRAAVRRTRVRRAGATVAPEILGRSSAIEQVRRYVSKAGASDANVLVTGESGTGKELVALAIHRHGRRSGGPFVAVNCSAIPETLLESELFGHERGAFTDAVQRTRGRFELADGGTLFFDEIGDLPASVQAKLLRVLQPPPGEPETCREFTLVGGESVSRADVRLIFATHRDLRALAAQGLFREDLLQRLDVLRIHVPPLRERREDVEGLARHFLERSCRREGRAPLELDPLVLEVLTAHDHPRNVRELEGLLHSIVVLKEAGDTVVLGDLPVELFGSRSGRAGREAGADEGADRPLETLAALVGRHVRKALERAGGNKSLAARMLDISRPTLDRKLRKSEVGRESDDS